MQVGKYFSCLLGNAVSNDDIIVTSQQRFVSGVVVCQLLSNYSSMAIVCRLAVDILNNIFSHALSNPHMQHKPTAENGIESLDVVGVLGWLAS